MGHTRAQVLIRWSLQKGFVPLPRSSNPGRIAENAAVFEFSLDDRQMAALDRLDAEVPGEELELPTEHRGKDPGADLVHLQGCTVTIDGIVESTVSAGGGHALPNSPANHCNYDTTAHPSFGGNPDSGYTACVEIWGNTVTIDNTGTHKGEVNAGGIRTDGDPRRGWIDIFALGDATDLPLSKAGSTAHFEAPVVTERIVELRRRRRH